MVPQFKKMFVCGVLLFTIGLFAGGFSNIDVYGASTQVIYVSTTGLDSGDGTATSPYRTISEGIAHLQAGDVLKIYPGTYAEKIEVGVSGSEQAPITIMGVPDAAGNLPTITQDESNKDALLSIFDQSYITLKDLNFVGNQKGDTPMGVLVEGQGKGYHFSGLNISEIESDDDAHGMAFYGTDGVVSLADIVVEDCQIFNCQLGTSEAMVFNGNVTDFLVQENIVYRNNNIGIDCIGFEGTAPSNDQARNGIIRNNIVHHISSVTNPAYDYEGAAGGIYVDGGKDILIENNQVTYCDIGIEVASEHKGKVTDGVKVMGNQIAHSGLYGIAVGGASKDNGYANDNLFEGNVVVANVVDLAIQQAHNNLFQGNVFYTTEEALEGRTAGQTITANEWLNDFYDLDAGKLLHQVGIIQGGQGGDLLRDKPLTREALMIVLWQLRGAPQLPTDGSAFRDVPANHWAAEVINWAKTEGITLGVGDNQFGLGQAVTRDQLNIFLERTLVISLDPEDDMKDQGSMLLRDEAFNRIAKGIGMSDNPYESIENEAFKYFQIFALLEGEN